MLRLLRTREIYVLHSRPDVWSLLDTRYDPQLLWEHDPYYRLWVLSRLFVDSKHIHCSKDLSNDLPHPIRTTNRSFPRCCSWSIEYPSCTWWCVEKREKDNLLVIYICEEREYRNTYEISSSQCWIGTKIFFFRLNTFWIVTSMLECTCVRARVKYSLS